LGKIIALMNIRLRIFPRGKVGNLSILLADQISSCAEMPVISRYKKVCNMRIKYTSIHNVIAERAKKEKQATKSERALAWFRPSR